jgi:hypothetical protein
MTFRLTGVDLLRRASRLATAQGNLTVSAYLSRAADDHERLGGCPASSGSCAYEVEAARVIMSRS